MQGLLGAGVLPKNVEMSETFDRAEALQAVRDTKLLPAPLSESPGQ